MPIDRKVVFMLENDYLMRLILLFVRLLQQALSQSREDPYETAMTLDRQIGEAVNVDPSLFFSLAGESMVTMLELSGTDRQLVEYIVRAMALGVECFHLAGDEAHASLRKKQMDALIAAYGLELTDDDLNAEALTRFINASEL
jgi:hypothetical protein